jgi:predicted ATPase
MKIQSLQYEDLSTGWKLDLIEFNPQLTLLVGASGVGKTQILKALQNLKRITQGESLNNLKWNIKFCISTGKTCQWRGEIHFHVETEQIIIDNMVIVDRTKERILFKGTQTVKLSHWESVISLLKEDEIIEIQQEIIKIIYDNLTYYEFFSSSDLTRNEYKNLEWLVNSNKTLNKKLYFLYTYHKKEFNKIKNSFIEIFPSIEDLKVDLNEISDGTNFFETITKVKEKNVATWIIEKNISSGMLKTLMHLAELYLCPDHSVILIDEFENSLGINCIDEVTYQILASERDLQFIITSHHPYIINKIPYEYWKLVTRKGSVVQAKNATEYGIGKSRLQAFTQLGNLPEFSVGIES